MRENADNLGFLCRIYSTDFKSLIPFMILISSDSQGRGINGNGNGIVEVTPQFRGTFQEEAVNPEAGPIFAYSFEKSLSSLVASTN